MSNEIFQAIEQVGREKGIEVDIIIQAVEDAYAAAAKKYLHSKEDLGARFDRETGALAVFARKKVVDDVTNPDLEVTAEEAECLALPPNEEGIIEIEKPRDGLIQLGRIAAQAAKQIIFQKVREAERDNIYREYAGRVGELINGVVKRFERGSIVVDLGRTEAVLPKKEQSKAERYSQGDRIRAVIVDVDRNAKGPQVIVSRTDERLLMKLFEMEVPEIYDGTVVIERAVHDPGDRAKVAVRSKDRDVDPVGACVGMKGSRVQSIIRELRGEKIDIVQYSDDVSTFITNALNPAKVNRVQLLDSENKALEVVVDDEQLSLAIGKKGQNVRLASRLVGWKIEIKSEQEKKREVEAELERRARDGREMETFINRAGDKTGQRLVEGGLRSLDAIVEGGVEGLTLIPGIGPRTAEKLLALAEEGLRERAVEEEAARQLAEEEAARAQAEEEAVRLRAEEEAAAVAAAAQAELEAQAGGDDEGSGESGGAGSGESTDAGLPEAEGADPDPSVAPAGHDSGEEDGSGSSDTTELLPAESPTVEQPREAREDDV